MPTLSKTLLSALALVGLSLPLQAGDFWVDSVNGSNQNSGTSPADAWSSLTHALAVLPAPAPGTLDTIHVLPGDYTAASGEVFPLRPIEGQLLAATSGPEMTRLIDPGPLVVYDDASGATSFASGLDKLKLITDDVALRVTSTNLPHELTISGVKIEALGTGILATSVGADVDLELVGVVQEDTAIGVDLFAQGAGTRVRCSGQYCRWFKSPSAAVRTRTDQGDVDAHFVSSNFSKGAHGLWQNVTAAGSSTVLLEDCLLRGYGLRGVRVDGPGGSAASANLTLSRCTIAQNNVHGVGILGGAPNAWVGTLDGCILWDNADDLYLNGASATISNCDIGDGDLFGQAGNFSADPLFEDPVNAKFRLRYGSPCLDRLPLVAGALDMFGTPRGVDGDQDAQAAMDVGAFEFQTLTTTGSANIGSQMNVLAQGPQGQTAWYLVSRTDPLGTPLVTPYGSLSLLPTDIERLTILPTFGANGPAVLPVNLPNDPGLVGLVFTFQVLVRSTSAPSGAAFTNYITRTVGS